MYYHKQLEIKMFKHNKKQMVCSFKMIAMLIIIFDIFFYLFYKYF